MLDEGIWFDFRPEAVSVVAARRRDHGTRCLRVRPQIGVVIKGHERCVALATLVEDEQHPMVQMGPCVDGYRRPHRCIGDCVELRERCHRDVGVAVREAGKCPQV